MKISKEKKNEIIEDIINYLNQNRDEKENEYMHIDCLKEEIELENQNFHYSLNEFNFVINEIFI